MDNGLLFFAGFVAAILFVAALYFAAVISLYYKSTECSTMPIAPSISDREAAKSTKKQDWIMIPNIEAGKKIIVDSGYVIIQEIRFCDGCAFLSGKIEGKI